MFSSYGKLSSSTRCPNLDDSEPNVVNIDLIDKARTTIVGNRASLQRLQASMGIPVTGDSDDPAYTNFNEVIDEWALQVRSKTGDVGHGDSDSEDINRMLFSAIVQEAETDIGFRSGFRFQPSHSGSRGLTSDFGSKLVEVRLCGVDATRPPQVMILLPQRPCCSEEDNDLRGEIHEAAKAYKGGREHATKLGHVSYEKLSMMMTKDLVVGLPKLDVRNDTVCSGCQFGKAHQLPFHSSSYRSKAPLDLVHIDVFGPVKQTSVSGMRYMITFTDDFSRFTWVYFMKEKSEAITKFKVFRAEAEKVTGLSIQVLRSDNGGEYISHEFNELLNLCKMKRQLTCPNTPQQNGVSERKNRSYANSAYVINRIPQHNLEYKSPYEKLFKWKPNVSYLRVFGSVCYVFIPSAQRHQLEKKVVRCIFVGYDNERKGWRCCDPITEKCFISRHVVFDETSSWWSPTKERLPDTKQLVEEMEKSRVSLTLDDETNDTKEDDGQEETGEVEVAEDNQGPWNTCVYNHHSDQEQGLRRSMRVRKPNPKYANVAEVIDEPVEPENFAQANTMSEWRSAMNDEMSALMKNETWDLVPKPEGVNCISCKWVYKLKFKSDGSIDRYKARLVARGFNQQLGLDYEETFSPVAKLTTVRVLIAVAISNGWSLFQMDVNNAFLYGTLDHVIYIDQPLGFESLTYLKHVCKLKKAIYSLKQSPRAWYGKISEFLEVNGFISMPSDASLFVKQSEMEITVVLVYVDDLIITGNDMNEMQRLKANLSTRFKMKDLGKLQRFLGLELEYLKGGGVLHHNRYTIDLLSRPDIAFSVGVLSRFMQNPKRSHLHAVRRVLRYVKATMGYGIWFKREPSVHLVGFCDADYGGDPSSRKSTTGYVFKIGNSAVSWCSKLQPTVSLSTTEAEYRASALAAQESMWLSQLLRDLGQDMNGRLEIWCDNKSAIQFAGNPTFHARTKHVEIHYHYVREKFLNGEIDLKYVDTKDQLADMFTKGLSRVKMLEFMQKLGMVYTAHVEREIDEVATLSWEI
ncbi:hypothetical protein E3N88_30774 [Mikania micrantha]|uniref:Integrase catalytic domain-containing protein n=1 Tax=Mikania micrantha TaxID=192012 RepID=A0A5N6MMS5_9ASTR|nr:hypothetical protein E3N88_30774 [Mikania micrantha]